MKRKNEEEWLNELGRIYRENPQPSKDVDLEAYKQKLQENEEKWGKYDDVIPRENRYNRIPLKDTIDRMKEAYLEVEGRYKNNKGKKYKDYNPEDY